MKSFSQAKADFDAKYNSLKTLNSFISVDTKFNITISIKDKNNLPNEEYYKWQFFYSLINSNLYQKDYLGAEVYFPKGNQKSNPIKIDGAIFDEENWFEYYQSWREDKNQNSLDWLRKHLVCVIEFKKDNVKDVDAIYNQQLKPAMKESESDFCLGVLYAKERLYLFQKKGSLFIRLDESFNIKGDKSSTKELSLELTDSYFKIPSFEQILKRTIRQTFDRSQRKIEDLDLITGIYSKQLKDGISDILRVMDKHSLKNQRGYEILIQVLALKIFDEKRSLSRKSKLDFYITNEEKISSISDPDLQKFIKRIRSLYQKASSDYHYILKRDDTETISWKKESHIKVLSEIVEQFQDYSFVESHKTDLYQLVFYKFANEFSKSEKGQFVTPIPLIDFLVKIVNPRSDEEIIDPTCGIADFLSISFVNSKSKLDDKNIFGIDNDEQMIMLAQLNMLLNGDGNAILMYKPDKGSITWKFDSRNSLVELNPKLHKNGDWDNWKDQTKLKKFDVVLTNPPFGEDRKYEPKTIIDKEIIEMYQLWHDARSGNWIDLGLVFLENSYRILKENGRMGIVLSNSIASIERWEKAREWLLDNMRIVAIFDLPSNVFADTGVNTTLIVAYKPNVKTLKKLKKENYSVFVKDIKNVGYEIRTSKRVKFFNPLYKIDTTSFEIMQDENGTPLLDEEFSSTVEQFKEWAVSQEKLLQDLFIKEK